ncbi:cobalt-precorrin-6A reductase [Photorhabdus heterorhabditis]|uniref:Cobalt-precorrin-6A reductase n=1 Tax=Photorhabdus heterorhabditis TaxID=880156 RepID=A0A5B0VQQ7_9GAMM|nr:cobalt-precorrin-6A reductase [Photorhabdus heterorhabditis]KAA1176957.1 cobalt-precorrin-6A reductase [Photorhabdus heterorhabditis]KOY60980.1 cobalt-precorrin-6X reductase [Photorhabdus heterorhabditis]MBS9441450.1 cobalt-precorrin-6A reductase [Photorhabdus heterorhabditis]
MNPPAVHVFGGTSDARLLCRALDAAGVRYRLSVATDAGRQLAGEIRGDVVVGRMDTEAMMHYFDQHKVRWVIDASHPYAEALSQNVITACRRLSLKLTRYQRPSEIDLLNHPLLHKADSVEAACDIARTLGQRILLTTGSKQLALYQRLLPEKTLLVRVLPTAEVLVQCEALGLGVDHIIALRGPFTAEFNHALYEFCHPDVVITKESGAEGGYQQKVAPCLALNIPCIVVCRPASSLQHDEGERVSSLDEFVQHLIHWQEQRGQ